MKKNGNMLKKLLLLLMTAALLLGSVSAAIPAVQDNTITLSGLNPNTTKLVLAAYDENGQLLYTKVQSSTQPVFPKDLTGVAALRVFETDNAMKPTAPATEIPVGSIVTTTAELREALETGGTYWIEDGEYELSADVTVGGDTVLNRFGGSAVSLASLDIDSGITPEDSFVTITMAAGTCFTVPKKTALTVGKEVTLSCAACDVDNNGEIFVYGTWSCDTDWYVGSGTVWEKRTVTQFAEAAENAAILPEIPAGANVSLSGLFADGSQLTALEQLPKALAGARKLVYYGVWENEAFTGCAEAVTCAAYRTWMIAIAEAACVENDLPVPASLTNRLDSLSTEGSMFAGLLTDEAGFAWQWDADFEAIRTQLLAGQYTKLTSLTLDDGYSIPFDPEVRSYTVTIPAGRPRIPQISAVAEEGEVRLVQATIADGETTGTAEAIVSNGAYQSAYTVVFEKDSDEGFQLQYEDRYQFVPAYTLRGGESFTYGSSSASVVSVDTNGVMRAKQRSNNPVTITAYAGGRAVDTLTVDKVVKAPLNLFLIIGQSNAYGYYDAPNGQSFDDVAPAQIAQCDAPAPGTVWCDDITTSYDDHSFSGMYDLSKKRSGFSPALGREWYDLTGEKTLMLQTAVGSTPIEAWTPDSSLRYFGLDCYAMTLELFSSYQQKFSASNSNFEINRIYAFWAQGETCEEFVYNPGQFTWKNKNGIPNYPYSGDWYGPTSENLMKASEYYTYFMQMFNGLKNSIGLEFIGILPVRSMTGVSSAENLETEQLVDLVAPRAAQYALNYSDRSNIAIVTRQTELGRTEAYPFTGAEGWGYMGCNNIHFNQRGYNAIGADAARNTFAMMTAGKSRASKSIEILDSNGSTTLEDGDTLVLDAYSTHQITAIVLPLYAEATALTFTPEKKTVCTVDDYGLITAKGRPGQSTTIAVSNGELTKTITVTIR